MVVGPGRLCGAPGAALGDGWRGPQHARYGETREGAEGLTCEVFYTLLLGAILSVATL